MIETSSDSRAINRISAILNSFSEHDGALSLAEISRRIDLPKSTTFRFLEALVQQGVLSKDPESGKYRLGFQLIRWGALAQSSIGLRREALPVLQRLAETTGETAILSMRFGHTGISTEIIESRQPVRLAMRPGARLMLHAGASSKVLWAFLPDEEIEHILSQIELAPLEKNSITDPEAMRGELKAIRRRGYATSFEETDRGAMGIAAPVYDHTGQPIAGIGIAAPITRVPSEGDTRIVNAVLSAARELSERLGAPANEEVSANFTNEGECGHMKNR